MRNGIKFSGAILTAVLAVACAKAGFENSAVTPENPDGGGRLVTLYSTIEQTDGTRIKLTNDSALSWQEGDKFKVVCKGATDPATFTLKGNPSEGKFEGTLPTGTSSHCYAVVNYFENSVAVNDGKLDLDIKQDKYAWANGISKEGIPLVAKVEKGGSTFRHIFGLLKVTLSATETFSLKRIALHDLAGNMLWGKCSVPIKEDGSLDCDNITMTEGDNTITMTLNTPREIGATGVAYYLPVPQGALADGFSIVLYEAADDTKINGIGRAYTFMQKITGTMAMPRAGILGVNAPVTAKPEAYEENGRGYYKSLFVNAGKGLDAFKPGDEEDGIPAIGYMGLDEDYEYINTSNTDTQTGIITQNDDDANGVLLYPDGSPRFRLVFNRGGSSVSHGQSLGEDGRGRFKTFFDNGGSYSGVCAGAFLAAQDVSSADAEDKPFTYNLIPVTLTHTGLPHPMSGNPAIYTNMEILSAAKTAIESGLNGDGKLGLLLGDADEEGNIYNIGSNVGIKDVRHHGGGYLPDDQSEIAGVEKLMKYWYSETCPGDETDFRYYRGNNFYTDYPTNKNKNVIFWSNSQYGTDDIKLDGPGKYHYISAWAYKGPNGNTGRAVCTGSHPEVPGRTCDVQFTGFMFRYAMEGNGEAFVKSTDLTLGQTRYMNATPSSYSNPADNDAGIGDGQYHHFTFTSNGIDNFVLRLDSQYDKNSGIDLYLGLRKGGKAWLSNADYTLCNKGGQKEIRIKHLPAGNWYVSVYCATKVTAEQGANSCTYSGKTQVLNGVPYSISIAQDGSAKDFFPSAFGGGDGDDFTDSMDD